MTTEFITYEQSLALKELGFDEPCFGRYYYKESYPMLNPQSEETELVFEFSQYIKQTEATILSPLYQQAFRWFREKHNLRGFIGFRSNTKQFDYHIYDMSLSGKEYVKQRTMEAFNKDPKVGTYEEAELECLNTLIQIVKNK